jgi:chemotaxis protein MotB
MNQKRLLNLFVIALFALLSACVPQRKYMELETRAKKAESDNESLKKANEQFTAKVQDLESQIVQKNAELAEMQRDTADCGKQYRQLRIQYDKINELNDILSRKSNELLSQATGENQKLASQLSQTQEALQKKEDALKALEKSLNEKQADIDKANKALEAKEQQLGQLQDLLSAQKAASDALKIKLENSLMSYKDKGISVYQKEGKVYVNMEAKLLFASGSIAVDPKGKQALIDLAKAIENEVDMEVIVEGHTDTDKISSSTTPKDNWELSVLRATEVVKIMTANSKIKPAVLSASGRSEYHPVDPNDKAKNRRIEIILQPDLNELYNIIEGKN